MEQWVDEVNFADSGLFLGDLHTLAATRAAAEAAALATSATATLSSTHESSGSSADGATTTTTVSTPLRRDRASTIVSPQWPLNTPTPTPTPTPLTPTSATPQELHAAAAIVSGLAPSFETYLGVPPAFIFQCARSRTEAALLYEVTSVALEMDVLLENVREQLHDRRRISDWLMRDATVEKRNKASSSSSVMVIKAALLALQQQAHGVNERNLLQLLERFHKCLQKLFDLQFPLAQSIENCAVSADELEDLGKLDSAALRRKLLEVQVALLERLRTLEEEDAIPLASNLVSAAQLQQLHGVAINVCWPAASNSEESKRSTMDDVRLSSSSSSMHSTFSASSALEERRRHIEDAEDLNRTFADHHEFPEDDNHDDENENNGRQEPEGLDQASSCVNERSNHHSSQQRDHLDDSRSLLPAATDVPNDNGGGGRERAESYASDHALSESVY